MLCKSIQDATPYVRAAETKILLEGMANTSTRLLQKDQPPLMFWDGANIACAQLCNFAAGNGSKL